MDIGGIPSHAHLLDSVGELLQGHGERRPFAGFLRNLEARRGYAFAALYLHPPAPASPQLICPSADSLRMPEPPDFVVTYPRLAQPPNRVFSLSDVEGEAASRSPYASRFLQPNRLADVLALNVHGPASLRARLVVGIDDSRRFGPEDPAFFRALSPHLESALYAFARQAYLESRNTLYGELVSRMGIGEIRLDRGGAIVYTNARADALLDEGHLLARRNGRLYCPHADSQRVVQAAIDDYLGNEAVAPSEPLLIRAMDALDFASLLIRQLPDFPPGPEDEVGAVGIYIADRVRKARLSAEQLVHLFGFSIAEARVAAELSLGRSVAEIALQLHLSPNTVRTHISRIYTKTGINRESALVGMLTRTLASTWQALEQAS